MESFEEEKVAQSSRRLASRKAAESTGKNLEESEDIDGLIKWAKNLPDDIPLTSGSSFFLK